jgi:hypothetical protein
MDYSIFFIKFYGYFCFLMAAALLLSKDGRETMLSASKDKSFVVLTGFISLLMGLPVIILHNIWTADVLGFITFVGWMSVLKGVVRIAKPSFVVQKMENYTGASSKIWLVVALIIGAGLMYAGYYPYWS